MAQHHRHHQYPVSVSPSFFHHGTSSPASLPVDALHALRYDGNNAARDGDGGIDGQLMTTLHADAGSKEIHLAAAGTNVTMNGKMQRVEDEELECVLLWDEGTKSYILHRLSTSTRLHPAASSDRAPAAATATATTPRSRDAPSTTATGNATARQPPRPPATNRVASSSHGMHLSPHPGTNTAAKANRSGDRSAGSASPSPRPVSAPTHQVGLGLELPAASAPSSATRPSIGRKGIAPVSSPALGRHGPVERDRDDDLASASEEEGTGIGMAADSDDDIDFEESLALPPSQAPVPSSSLRAYASPAQKAVPSFAGAGTTRGNGHGRQPNASKAADVVSSEEEDDEEEEEDFDDLANDLEESLAVPPQQQPLAAPSASVPQADRSTQAGKKVPQNKAFVDSDIASSSESEDDSGSDG